MFLHYPPTSIGEMESPFTLMAQEFGAEKVIYSHCHGEKRYDDKMCIRDSARPEKVLAALKELEK